MFCDGTYPHSRDPFSLLQFSPWEKKKPHFTWVPVTLRIFPTLCLQKKLIWWGWAEASSPTHFFLRVSLAHPGQCTSWHKLTPKAIKERLTFAQCVRSFTLTIPFNSHNNPGKYFLPILQMRNSNSEQLKQLAQGHTARKLQNKDVNSGLSDTKEWFQTFH